jgi:chromosome segregation protein
MRLTKLKLAGFKSFVDPTQVSLPGQLVGVVGPNGCGKSNIIDAVRWVLGESKASALRGESMQDVIFNGSTNRKPVSRASVELVFDNSLGRASGQWSQYAELAIKRVLTRAGDSEYYINNLRVRRKDIQDVFLGTGLGARAYAIIEQGMISRIIEAKPDELRVFLEEAAGVTKYKERRRETEGRIADTRENLTRLEDIRQELATQLVRLEAQAEVARKYHTLNHDLTHKQQLLWLFRRNEAQGEQQRLALEIDRLGTEFEGQVAGLRETEATLEATRDAHFQANDALHRAQSELYGINAEVARLETEIRHLREGRRQQEARQVQLQTERLQWDGQGERIVGDLERWSELLDVAELRYEEAAAKYEASQDRLPEADAAVVAAQDEVGRLRSQMSVAEQRLQVEQAHRANAERTLAALQARRERLEQEKAGLAQPDPAMLAERQAELEMLREQQAEAQEKLAEAQRRVGEIDLERRDAIHGVQQAVRTRAEVEAKLAALEAMQKRAQASGKQGEWLRRHGLDNAPPFWRRLHVEQGWENAFEAVLRERLNAVAEDDLERVAQWAGEAAPEAKLAVLLPHGESAPAAAPAASGTLAARVRSENARDVAALAEWLAGVHTADSVAEAMARRDSLESGQSIVTRDGHWFTRHSVVLFAADDAQHGALERQQEIERLAEAVMRETAAVEAAQEQQAALEAQRAELDELLQNLRRSSAEAQQRIHQVQMETLKLEQMEERYRERSGVIESGLADLLAEEEAERERMLEAEFSIGNERESVAEFQDKMAELRENLERVERRLRDERDAVITCDNARREADFSRRECQSKLDELRNQREMSGQQLARIDRELQQCAEFLENAQYEVLEPQLQAALETREAREAALTTEREALEGITNSLRGLEEQRLRVEQSLEPLRSKTNELQLKEQAARLNAEQFQQQLTDANADEAYLTEKLPGIRAGSLQGEINRLQQDLEALGAVNLAALQELESATERKGYLDAQAADLGEALDTLENAIRRIDRETRDLLQSTFDVVNGHFSTLFPQLFGGGQARLIMTGDEILDAGVQVMAQPPGKKNSTIHLLSGGEKALTAISLVFSLFQLNPAPFCLLDEVDAPLDDTNTERFCLMVKRMSAQTQFLYISHSRITMEMAEQLVGVTMPESGVSRIVEVDIEEALRLSEKEAA